MKKTIFQGVLTVVFFIAIYYALKQIDWVRVFNIHRITDKTEEKIGDLFWEDLKKTEKEIDEIHVVNSIDSIVIHVCKLNKINRDKLKIHIVEKDEVNAFAFPNGHLIIYSGLILESDNQEELIGVICHEIAHIELNHVIKKLVKEIGLTVLISISTGNNSSEIIKETTKMLSSSAFDRSLEKEADIKAVDYLLKCNVNPKPFSDFLFKLSKNEDQTEEYLRLINTHPNSKQRAEYINKYSKGKLTDFQQIITCDTWDKLKLSLKVQKNRS